MDYLDMSPGFINFFITASPEELFDSLVGNTPDKSQNPIISSSAEDNSLVMFTPPKKGKINATYI